MTAGGDHLGTLPILCVLAIDGTLSLIQFDSHTGLFDSYFGGHKFTHALHFAEQ
jgi:guanidinopropionase